MTETNRRSPVSLVPGPVDPVDPVESVEPVDHVDLVELIDLLSNWLLIAAWGFRLSVMPLCFLSVDTNRCFCFSSVVVPDRGRPELRRALCRSKSPRAKAGEDMIERIADW